MHMWTLDASNPSTKHRRSRLSGGRDRPQAKALDWSFLRRMVQTRAGLLEKHNKIISHSQAHQPRINHYQLRRCHTNHTTKPIYQPYLNHIWTISQPHITISQPFFGTAITHSIGCAPCSCSLASRPSVWGAAEQVLVLATRGSCMGINSIRLWGITNLGGVPSHWMFVLFLIGEGS